MNPPVLFLKEHVGDESAFAYRASFDGWVEEIQGITLSDILETFTFVTDFASTMLCIAGVSASSRKVSFCELGVNCIAHQLNTAMKKTIAIEEQEMSVSYRDLISLKTLIRLLKQRSMNKDMSNCQRLQQEMETRFASTLNIVNCFRNLDKEVKEVIENNSNMPGRKVIESLWYEDRCEDAARFSAHRFERSVCTKSHMCKRSSKPDASRQFTWSFRCCFISRNS